MDAHYDPLALENADDFIAASLSRLARGVKDRRHAFHTISLATIGLNGTPQLRTVVLRGFEQAAWRLSFHTDKRAAKFAELLAAPQASVLAYDPGAKLQIRLNGLVTMRQGDEWARQVWANMQATSRACYHTPNPPGEAPSDAPALSEAEAQANFCVCSFAIAHIDALYLRAAGHLRAQATNFHGEAKAAWVAP